MRRTLICSAVAAMTLGAGALAVGAAGAAGPVAAPPSIPDAPIDLEQVFEILTPEQLGCIAENAGDLSVVPADPAAALDLLSECDVSTDELMEIVSGEAVSTGEATASTDLAASTATPDAATVAAVLETIGLGADAVACIDAGLAAATVGDDAEALTILQGCGLSLAEVLQAVVDHGAAAPGETSAAPASTAAAASTGDPVTDMMTNVFESMGISLTPEQIDCLAGSVTGGLDPNEQTAIVGLLEECGISITDLMSGG